MFSDMGIGFEVMPADIDEEAFPGERPVEYAIRAAQEKGLSVATRLVGEGRRPWIVSADTVVVLDSKVLTKPADAGDAAAMLGMLSGRTHVVVTGWAVGRHQGPWISSHCETAVRFHSLTPAQIAGYVATGEGMDKAGAYAIQEIGAFLVDRIDGDYFNVVGLPISRVVRALLELGAIRGFPGP
jgi:septum formation protein